MANPLVTEDDLIKGVREVGGLGRLSESAQRDSPFGRDQAKPARTDKTERSKAAPKPTPKPAKQPKPLRPTPPPMEVPQPSTKRQKFPVDVTVPMTPEMRRQVRELADELQRRRTDKAHRFTANDVFRVFIELGLKHFQLRAEADINTPEDLLAAVEELLQDRAMNGS